MESLVFIMCLPILIPLWIIYLIFMVTYKPKRGRKRNYYKYKSYNHYDDYNYDDDIHDTGEIFNRFQDGTCSKSDMELLMEDDDIRNEFMDEL